jgi:hypothetical protein
MALHYDLTEMETIVASLAMGQVGSTTDYDHHPECSRWMREIILASAGVWARMRASASSSFGTAVLSVPI